MGLGAFCEHVVVPQAMAVPIDSSLSPSHACLIGCGVTTGLGAALNTVNIPPGASVAIVGLGGVGLSALQGARIVGAGKIVAVDSQAWKFDLARKLGATDCVDASDGDPVHYVIEVENHSRHVQRGLLPAQGLHLIRHVEYED